MLGGEPYLDSDGQLKSTSKCKAKLGKVYNNKYEYMNTYRYL